MKAGVIENKEVVRTLIEKIPAGILRRTTLQRKKVSFKEEVEDLGLGQESGEWPKQKGNGEEENLSGESEKWDEDSLERDGEQDSLCMILAEEKRRYHDRELQTHPSSAI